MGEGKWLPERLQQAREQAGLTKSALARLVGVKRSAVQQWENGQTAPKGENLTRLARVLQKPEGWFYGLEADQPEPVPVAAMPEPASPDWEPAPYPGPSPSLEQVLRELPELRRRIDELERRLREHKGKR